MGLPGGAAGISIRKPTRSGQMGCLKLDRLAASDNEGYLKLLMPASVPAPVSPEGDRTNDRYPFVPIRSHLPIQNS